MTKKIVLGIIVSLIAIFFVGSTNAKSYQCSNPVSGQVFIDYNGNGARDFSEPGVPDAKVTVERNEPKYKQGTKTWKGVNAGYFVFEKYVPCGGPYVLTAEKGKQSFSINIEIGDSKTPDDFLPQVKLMR